MNASRVFQNSLHCEQCNVRHENKPNLHQWIAETFSSDGAISPVCEENYKKVIHLHLRREFSDPEHYGHPLHKLVELLSRKEF